MKIIINYLKSLCSNKNFLRTIALILLAFSLGYRLGMHRYGPQPAGRRVPCDLRLQVCKVTVSDNRHISVAIEPKNIPSDQLITVVVTLEQFKDPPLVSLALTTLPQNDPLNQLPMSPIENNKFKAQFKLIDFGPTHTNWLMLVKIDSGQQTITIPFKFEAD